jgi:RecJ-like exonuclease
MELPNDVCLLQTDQKAKCPFCKNGLGPCSECRGNGFHRGLTPQRCPRCGGSGWGDAERHQGCIRCGGRGTRRGKGLLGPPCFGCRGSGLVRCRECSGSGSIPLCRALAHFGPREYIERIADVMDGCSEADEHVIVERGWRLYNVLVSVYQFASVECAPRLPIIFPDALVEMIKAARDRIRGRETAPACQR